MTRIPRPDEPTSHGRPEPPRGWWWSARHCPRCSELVATRVAHEAVRLVPLTVHRCIACGWDETTPG